jgi:hypothetical protein
VIIRRAFYSALFGAAVLLPAWNLVGWGVFGGGGWVLIGVILGSGALALAMLGLAGLVYARKSVRQNRAVSWPDAALLAASYAAVIALGFYSGATTLLVIAVILVLIATFWTALWELVAETRKRVREAFAAFEVPPPQSTGRPVDATPRMDGEYIVIETSSSRPTDARPADARPTDARPTDAL